MAAVSVGIFGGAFDPPHLGHVELARAGIEQFALGRLLVRVVGAVPSDDELEEALRGAGIRRGVLVEIGDEELEWE